MSALTGVGPSMASGSQTWSGTCPDLPTAPAEDEDGDSGGDGHAGDGGVSNQRCDGGVFEATGALIVKEQRSGLRVEPYHSEQEGQVADSGGDEGFFCCCCGGWFLIPESDEEVGGEADELPTHEEEQKAVGDDDAEHCACEEREEAEEAGEVFVVVHVAGAVDEDQQADEGDHDEHDGGEGVEHPAELQPLAAVLKPGEVEDLSFA